MTDEDFKSLVGNMRNAQRMFFKTRQNEWLYKSKEYEKLVDDELSEQKKLL